MLVEQTEAQLQAHLDARPDCALIFFHTPLCGTCKIAKRMLTITTTALENLTIFSCNINLMPERAQAWKIENVPALVILHEGEIYKVVYAFQSVDYLFHLLKPYAAGASGTGAFQDGDPEL